MCSLRDAAAKLDELGVAVYALSLDDVADLAAFAKKQKLNFKLLSDPDGSVAAKYGVLLPRRSFSRRVTFVLDEEGVLLHIDDGVRVATHGSDLVRVIRELQE